jgi:hypothetical protein
LAGGPELKKGLSLEKRGGNPEGRRKELFLQFMNSILRWVPEERKTAGELLQDPWLNDKIERMKRAHLRSWELARRTSILPTQMHRILCSLWPRYLAHFRAATFLLYFAN